MAWPWTESKQASNQWRRRKMTVTQAHLFYNSIDIHPATVPGSRAINNSQPLPPATNQPREEASQSAAWAGALRAARTPQLLYRSLQQPYLNTSPWLMTVSMRNGREFYWPNQPGQTKKNKKNWRLGQLHCPQPQKAQNHISLSFSTVYDCYNCGYDSLWFCIMAFLIYKW